MIIPNHDHTASVYSRCNACSTFGTPMYYETHDTDFPAKCGNCGSMDTATYYPRCCITQACGEAYGMGYQAGGNDVLNGDANFTYLDDDGEVLDDFDEDDDDEFI